MSSFSDLSREWSAQRSRSCKTAAEKVEVLVCRDKILRAVREKKSANKPASDIIIRGTCPEICPEKERYERESQVRVSAFERHGFMVKDFARQAADQEMPLPSELRTQQALRTTMDYLLKGVLSTLPEDSSGSSGWYDFIWRRVREIRKEITQQRLKGVEICLILEEMARFHIIAFHLCCESDKNYFDSKLNLQNLNDCLASLGRLYGEMETQGIYSPNVAEFRAYELLLRVWTGKVDLVKITNDIRRLPPQYQDSSDLKFALNVVSSCNNKNFREYADLMKQADFLTACVMHLSTPIVQASALNCISASSGLRNKPPVNIPYDQFANLVGLDTPEEVVNFCDYHGLEAAYDGRNARVVTLKPGGNISKDPKFFPRMRSAVVEEKYRQRNLAEWIAKKSLAQIPDPNVVEVQSFGPNGVYCGPDPFEESPETKENAPVISASQPHRAAPFSSFVGAKQHSGPAITASITRFPSPIPAKSAPVSSTSSTPVRSAPGFTPFVPNTPYLSSIVQRVQSAPQQPFLSSQPNFSQPSAQKVPLSPVKTTAVVSQPTSRKRHFPEDEEPVVDSAGSATKYSHYAEEITDAAPVYLPPVFTEREATPDVEKVYPHPSHPTLIRARTVCQATAALKTLFSAWRTVVNDKRTSRELASISSPKKMIPLRNEAQLDEERLWQSFQIHSDLIYSTKQPLGSVHLLILYFGNSSVNRKVLQWIYCKFGISPKRPSETVSFCSEDSKRRLDITFVNYGNGSKEAENTVKKLAFHLGAVLCFCESASDVDSAADFVDDIVNQRRGSSDLPGVLICPESSKISVGNLEMFNELWRLCRNYIVDDFTPSFQLNDCVWESLRWLFVNHSKPVIPKMHGLLFYVANLFCDFVEICEDVQKECRAAPAVDIVVDAWNRFIEVKFNGAEITFSGDTDSIGFEKLLRGRTVPEFLTISQGMVERSEERLDVGSLLPVASRITSDLSPAVLTAYERVSQLLTAALTAEPVVVLRIGNLEERNVEDVVREFVESACKDREETISRNSPMIGSMGYADSLSGSSLGWQDVGNVIKDFDMKKNELTELYGRMNNVLLELESL